MLIHSEGETVGLRIVVGALVVEYGQGIPLFCPCGYRKNRIPSFVQPGNVQCLGVGEMQVGNGCRIGSEYQVDPTDAVAQVALLSQRVGPLTDQGRSEERRVGREWGTRV